MHPFGGGNRAASGRDFVHGPGRGQQIALFVTASGFQFEVLCDMIGQETIRATDSVVNPVNYVNPKGITNRQCSVS